MAKPSLGEATFPLGYCEVCTRAVLTHLDLGPADEEIRRCVHCDALVTATLTWVDTSELEATGYAIVDARICGNGGGCSAGCGVRQRT